MSTGRPLTRDPAPTAVRSRPVRPRPEARSPVDPTFSPSTAAAVGRARQHSVGDLLRRTARRVSGQARGRRRGPAADVTPSSTRSVNRTRARAGRPGPGEGRPARAAVHNCWQFAVLAFATARLGVVWCRSTSCSPREEVAFILDHSGARRDRRRGRAGPGGRGGAGRGRAATAGRAAGSALSGGAPATAGSDVDEWMAHATTARPDVVVADDDPIRLMYTSGTESRPKGAMLSSRALIAQYVSCIIDGGMSADDIEVHALPLYHCAQLRLLLQRRPLPRRDEHHPARRPTRRRCSPRSSASGSTKLFCPPTVWISLLRHPDFDTAGPVVAAQGLLRRVDHAGGGAARAAAPAARRRSCGTSTARPRWRRWRRSCGPQEQERRPARPAGPAINVETRIVDDDDNDVPAGEIGEIVHRSPQRMLGYCERRGEDRRGVPQRLVPLRRPRACSTTTATSRSSTARRT